MINDNLVLANGTSLNYFTDDGKFDLYIIINEPNDQKSIDDAIKYLDTINFDTVNMEELRAYLGEHYFEFGVELILKIDDRTYEYVR